MCNKAFESVQKSAYRGLNCYRSLSVASRHFTVKIDRQMTMAKDKTREQQTNAGSGVSCKSDTFSLITYYNPIFHVMVTGHPYDIRTPR